MPNNYILLERIELAASAASVTFSNIPQTGYTDLKVVISSRSTGGGSAWSDIIIKPNNSTTSISTRVLYGTGSAAASTTFTTGIPAVGEGTTGTASTFGNAEIYIPNYTSSNFKSFSADSVSENNATSSLAQLGAMLWSDTAAITSLVFTDFNSGNFVSGSTFSLYGLAALGTTPAIAPKASGGNRIDNDGTYWYHTFTSSGTFTPQVGLTCDALVVAGGGAGGDGGGGGGGAGGYRSATGLITTPINYTVTIGAGGAPVNAERGGAGTNSSFSTITSTGGGGGGGGNSAGGGSGGSGGGPGYQGSVGTGNAGSYSPSEGNNSGSMATDFATWTNGGGGGGAGAVGGNASSSSGGVGGAGSNSLSSWATATSTGVSGFYAGGGGGSGQLNAAGAGGSGGGGAGGFSNANGVSATVNTGSGGGGCPLQANVSGSGASGIIIIRYPIV
jgi:hypothetical protein